MLDFINYPVSVIMWLWHKAFGFVFQDEASGIVWALSVVFLVFTIRAALFKPFVKQVRSMRKMQEFAPQMKKIREKYANDKQRAAQEMQKLQSEGGFSMLGGCLPMLIQLPVFFGLLNVLRGFVPGEEKNYFFGSDEVKSFLQAKLFGVNLSAYLGETTEKLNTLATDRTSLWLLAAPLAILAAIATHMTARHSVERQRAMGTSTSQSEIMGKITMYLFPVGVLASAFFFPVAMLLYFLSTNVWTLGQQYLVYHRIDREEEAQKTEAIEKRQNLAPKPGQKPVAKPKRPANAPSTQPAKPAPTDGKPGTPDSSTKDTSTQKGSEQHNAARNGSPAKDAADVKPGEIPGIIQSRRGKKQSRKRR